MHDPLSRWERSLLAALAALCVVFAGVTLARSAYMTRRMTDADVYFRAAWALRSGESPYRIADTNGWHYHYSPVLAIVLMPLANPPPGGANDAGPWVPYPASILIWYGISLAALAAALHLMAKAIEDVTAGGDEDRVLRGGRRWWQLRVVPVTVCVIAVGTTLGRGQVNTLMALSLAAACAATIRGHALRAGVFLAAGVCLKPFLAVVLVLPLLRRQSRFFAGFLIGCIALFVLLPLLTLGWHRTDAVYRDWYQLRIKSMVVGTTPGSVDDLQVLRGDFASWGTVWYRTLHPEAAERPVDLPEVFRFLQTLFGLALVGTILATFRPRAPTPGAEGLRTVIAWGALVVAILPALTTTKPHYFALALLLVQGLVASRPQPTRQAGLPASWVVMFAAYALAQLLGEIPALSILADVGIVPYSSLLLFALAILQLRRLASPVAVEDPRAGGHRDPDSPVSP